MGTSDCSGVCATVGGVDFVHIPVGGVKHPDVALLGKLDAADGYAAVGARHLYEVRVAVRVGAGGDEILTPAAGSVLRVLLIRSICNAMIVLTPPIPSRN